LDILKRREINFRLLEESLGEENVWKWEAMDDRPHFENGKVVSVHTAKFKNSKGMVTFIFDQTFLLNIPLLSGPPTHAKAYQTLLRQEHNSNSSATLYGKTQFVNDGLGLEYDQCVVYDSPFVKLDIL
jgi:hypothetical protein